MPECATEDAARYPLSVYTPKLRATGAANAFEVSQLLRTAQRGMEAGIDSCKNFGPMTAAIYSDAPYLPQLQLQLDVHGCALETAMKENSLHTEKWVTPTHDDCEKTRLRLATSPDDKTQMPTCPVSRVGSTAESAQRPALWAGLGKMMQGAGYIRDLPPFARSGEVFLTDGVDAKSRLFGKLSATEQPGVPTQKVVAERAGESEVPEGGEAAWLQTTHVSRLLGGRRNTSNQEELERLWAAERTGARAGGQFTHADFLGGFESPDWPKSPQCGNFPGLRQAPTVRVRERGHRVTKLVNVRRKLEVRKVLKAGSMMIKDLLSCLQPGQWREVPQSTPTEPAYKVHALVRDPVDRFISMLNEVIRRGLLGECPEGKCDVERDGFDDAAHASMKSQRWYDAASLLIKTPHNRTAARRHWLERTVQAFIETSQCNLQYYGSEHSISQVQQLVAQGGGPGEPRSGEVTIHSLEELKTVESAKRSTFIRTLGYPTQLSGWTLKGCFERNAQFTERREREAVHENAPPFLPSHEEVYDLLTSSKQLGLPMLATYGQDLLCLGYPAPPLWADQLAEIGSKELKRLTLKPELSDTHSSVS